MKIGKWLRVYELQFNCVVSRDCFFINLYDDTNQICDTVLKINISDEIFEKCFLQLIISPIMMIDYENR